MVWALEGLLDLYMVHDVYQDEWDGMVISGLFMLVPWLLPALGILEFNSLPTQAMCLALLSGAIYLGSYWFYFRALFRFPDSPLIYVLWDTQVLVVPFLAWAWLDERLLPVHYFGIGLAFLGASLFSVRPGLLKNGFLTIVPSVFCAVFLFAAAMVVQDEVYRLAEGQFFDVYLTFLLGGALLAGLVVLVRPDVTRARLRRLARFSPGFIAIMGFSEIVSCSVILFSQRAIDLSPSVSFVSAIESSSTVFILLASLALAMIFERTRHKDVATLFRQQTTGWQEKLLAMTLLSVGIYCVAG